VIVCFDATLDALGRGFSAFRAGWFMRFHDALEPTDAERRERLRAYLDLLASRRRVRRQPSDSDPTRRWNVATR
jgi:hypothetical protein